MCKFGEVRSLHAPVAAERIVSGALGNVVLDGRVGQACTNQMLTSLIVRLIWCSLSISRGWGDWRVVQWWLHTIIAAVGCGFSWGAIGPADDRPTDCTAAHGHIAAFCIDGGLVTSMLCSTRSPYVRPEWNRGRCLALLLGQRVD